MKVQRTFDEDFVYSCYAVKETWAAICDDENINQDLFFPNMDRSNYWLEVRGGEDRLGVFLFRRMNHICYEAHTILLPIARGRATDAAKSAIDWMFSNTGCLRITTTVPEYNDAAIRLSVRAGLTRYGINEKSFKKGGILFNELLFGISKQG